MSATPLFSAALEYAGRGWSVIPLIGKKPALRTWKRWQRTQAGKVQLKRWFARPEVTGIAVICGAVSGGLVVRDFDDLQAYESWAQAHPKLAGTVPTVQTPRGRHLYFRSAVPAPTTRLDDGDLQAERAYVAAPPSLHPSGDCYQWLVPPHDALPVLDPYEAGLLHKRTEANKVHQKEVVVCGSPSHWGPQSLEEAIRQTLPTQNGQRHRRIFRFARALRAVPGYGSRNPLSLATEFRIWHDQALPYIRTQGFAANFSEFVAAWDAIRYPMGGLMQDVLERAIARRVPAVVAAMGDDALCLLTRVSAELQTRTSPEPFFLSARTAARLCKCDAMSAWRMLGLLERLDVLLRVDRGQSGKTGKAARWRYIGDATG